MIKIFNLNLAKIALLKTQKKFSSRALPIEHEVIILTVNVLKPYFVF